MVANHPKMAVDALNIITDYTMTFNVEAMQFVRSVAVYKYVLRTTTVTTSPCASQKPLPSFYNIKSKKYVICQSRLPNLR